MDKKVFNTNEYSVYISQEEADNLKPLAMHIQEGIYNVSATWMHYDTSTSYLLAFYRCDKLDSTEIAARLVTEGWNLRLQRLMEKFALGGVSAACDYVYGKEPYVFIRVADANNIDTRAFLPILRLLQKIGFVVDDTRSRFFTIFEENIIAVQLNDKIFPC